MSRQFLKGRREALNQECINMQLYPLYLCHSQISSWSLFTHHLGHSVHQMLDGSDKQPDERSLESTAACACTVFVA
jgi:hypothetical protein